MRNRFRYHEETDILNNNNEKNINKNIDELKDNGTLLISEVQNKVVLPYTSDEVINIFNNNKELYNSFDDVINNVFTKPFDYYRHQFTSRYRESYDLITKREHMSKMDGINLGSEMFLKAYLHPAIITACKNLNELNVYLDCLDKNELDDFKVFEIKYELHPMIIQNKIEVFEKINIFKRLKTFFKKVFSRNMKLE